jgi:hypothetical protein
MWLRGKNTLHGEFTPFSEKQEVLIREVMDQFAPRVLGSLYAQ